mgnify:CR=1 FL=1
MSVFVRLVDCDSPTAKRQAFGDRNRWYQLDQHDFTLLPGYPFAYWASRAQLDCFRLPSLNQVGTTREGLKTGDNARFVFFWHELSRADVCTRPECQKRRYVPHVKGGAFRRWYGNCELVILWDGDGQEIKRHPSSTVANQNYQFCKGFTWTYVTSGPLSVRYVPDGWTFNNKGPMAFADRPMLPGAVLNSKVANALIQIVAPTLDYTVGNVGSLPLPDRANAEHTTPAKTCLSLSKADWDSRERSWEYRRCPLLDDYEAKHGSNPIDENLTEISLPSSLGKVESLAEGYSCYTTLWTKQFKELHRLEEENNRIFIDLYGLQDELSPEVPYSEVTILQDELDKDARERGEIVFNKQEVLRQFVSYGVGCIFGRYSLDEDGLILANAGDTLDTYLERIPEPRLRPDESGILPITEDDDFPDDLPSQFRAFLRAAFGTEHYDENVQFLEEGLGRDLRSYFLKHFYKDHVKRYKKRPIYWLITSPKGSLRALIYLHRYNRDTVNRFLNDYLRPYQRKLEARRRTAEQSLNSGGLSGSERTKARKDIDRISAALEELSVWERDVVRPLAEQRVELDLDDGVKVNYGKLGAILETVKGLNS